jgi:hypothetical protein
VVAQWEALGAAGYDWWMRVTQQEHFENLNLVTGTLVGTVGTLPTVAEGGEYTELKIGDSPETATFYKYGGYIPLTLELLTDNSQVGGLPQGAGQGGIRKVSALVAAVFTDNRVGQPWRTVRCSMRRRSPRLMGSQPRTRPPATEWDTMGKRSSPSRC